MGFSVIAMVRPAFRFAPSPNGRLHLGHAYCALLNAQRAAGVGGRFLVRIEDIDLARCTPALVEAALADLAWLGLTWEEPVRRQSRHLDDYAKALKALSARHLLYPCVCSRQDIARAVAALPAGHACDPEGVALYPGTCRAPEGRERAAAAMAAGAPYALRLAMDRAIAAAGIGAAPLSALSWDEDGQGPAGESGRVPADPSAWGDAILARKDVPTSYHLSVVVDDALQGISHVVRGRDLFAATALHRLLQTLLDLPAPRYHHHGIVADTQGQKLAKSRGSPGLAALRDAGVCPGTVREMLGFGQAHPAESPNY